MTNYTSRPPPMTREEKLKERWLRRVVARQGYRLRKQRRWDVGAYDYGRYLRIFGPDDQLAAGDEIFGMTQMKSRTGHSLMPTGKRPINN